MYEKGKKVYKTKKYVLYVHVNISTFTYVVHVKYVCGCVCTHSTKFGIAHIKGWSKVRLRNWKCSDWSNLRPIEALCISRQSGDILFYVFIYTYCG